LGFFYFSFVHNIESINIKTVMSVVRVI
jgi:hypothetical protein